MAEPNHIERVAIVGASGRIGSHFVDALLKTGKHTVTALVRPESKATLPTGVKTAKVDYNDDGSSVAAALKGQQFLIITLAVSAPPDLHSKLVHAAGAAGIKYIMPNIYGFDTGVAGFQEDMAAFAKGVESQIKDIQSVGASCFPMVCGMWYEWSLGLPEPWFGFDIRKRTVTFFDDGNAKIGSSTWLQCGRALAALLSMPIRDADPSLERFANKPLYFASFRVSQREMLDSLHRVLGTTDKDWSIKYEPSAQRFRDGIEELQKGIRTGFAKMMYSRVFYPNGDGDYETRSGLDHDALGLEKEDLDEATKRTVDMVEDGWNPLKEIGL